MPVVIGRAVCVVSSLTALLVFRGAVSGDDFFIPSTSLPYHQYKGRYFSSISTCSLHPEFL